MLKEAFSCLSYFCGGKELCRDVACPAFSRKRNSLKFYKDGPAAFLAVVVQASGFERLDAGSKLQIFTPPSQVLPRVQREA